MKERTNAGSAGATPSEHGNAATPDIEMSNPSMTSTNNAKASNRPTNSSRSSPPSSPGQLSPNPQMVVDDQNEIMKRKSPSHTGIGDRSSNSAGPSEEEEIELEEAHFRRIVNAFRFYRSHSFQKLNKTESYLKSLPKQHQIYLSKYGHHLDSVRVAIEHNYEIIKLILMDVSQMFENVEHTINGAAAASNRVTIMDTEKVQSTLKQFVRDWSEDGADERKACYQPILDEIERLFPANKRDVKSVSVLVPGAGLGRLAHEIARRGYTCQGNEFSLFMLMASNFVLNKCHGVNLYRLYPWVHQYSNNVHSQDQVRYILFPDVNPSDLIVNTKFSMAAGDFLQVYTENDSWDCVATCFFLDTAKNVVEYIEAIWRILKPGGYWINLGPLLYHFADVPNENSIEPSVEDVLSIIKKCGFIMQGQLVQLSTTYAQNPFSMLKYEYKSIFFVCQKPPTNTSR